MMKLFTKTYNYQTELSSVDIFDLLKEQTVPNPFQTITMTDKLFAGQVSQSNFTISYNWIPFGFACIMKGEITELNGTEIYIKTHVTRWLLIILLVLALWTGTIIIVNEQFESIPIFLIAMLIFRLYIHILYLIGRNRGINRIIKFLNLKTKHNKS